MMYLRPSEHPLAQLWLAQFCTSEDRALASQLINQINLVSGRDFESGIESALIGLQTQCNATIAVYPVTPKVLQRSKQRLLVRRHEIRL